jgi:hypothetical protein
LLTWRDAEESAELMQLEAMWVEENAHTYADIEEIEQPGLRSRIANVFVSIGVKLDPTAVENLETTEVA